MLARRTHHGLLEVFDEKLAIDVSVAGDGVQGFGGFPSSFVVCFQVETLGC